MKKDLKKTAPDENVSLMLRISSEIIEKLTLSPEENILVILDGISQILGKAYIAYFNFEEQDKPLRYVLPEGTEGPKLDASSEDVFQSLVLESREKTVVISTPDKIKGIRLHLIGEGQIKAFLGIPVQFGTDYSGVLAVACTAPRNFSDIDLFLVKNFAKFIGFEKIRLHNYQSKQNIKTKYKTIYEDMEAGVMLLKDQVIVDVNKKFCQLLGTTQNEALGKRPEDFSPKFQPDGNPSDRKIKMYLKASLRKKQELEWSFKREDGKLIYTEVMLTKMSNLDDADTMLFVYNVSRQKTYEKELMEAREKAEKANHMKSVFLSNMSHEIRTPLNSIIGFSELLLDEESTSEERTLYSEMISNAGKSLLQLIEDIIDISKIEAGHLNIRKNNFDAHKVLDELLASYNREKNRIGKSNLALKITKAIKNPKLILYSDEYRFRQVFINLLTNAIKFTENGLVEFGYRSVSPQMIQFFVKDTGKGIDPSEIKLIFERFGQAQQNYVENKEGKGLGLAITHSLVKLLGGKIWVDSEPGKGSTFYFTLPTGRTLSMHKELQEIFGPILKDKTILIVDNIEENFHFIRGALQSTMATFLWANGGIEAVKICSENPEIDLVLMDLMMPDLDGMAATHLIKNMNNHLPIIAQTAFNYQVTKKNILKNGFSDYIIKPINFNELYNVISKYLLT